MNLFESLAILCNVKTTRPMGRLDLTVVILIFIFSALVAVSVLNQSNYH